MFDGLPALGVSSTIMSFETTKLPVWATVGAAFGLYIKRSLRVIRIGWFPAALIAGLLIYLALTKPPQAVAELPAAVPNEEGEKDKPAPSDSGPA